MFPESWTFEEFMETRQNEDLYSIKSDGKKCISCFGPAPSLRNTGLICGLLGRTGFFSGEDTKYAPILELSNTLGWCHTGLRTGDRGDQLAWYEVSRKRQ